MVELTELLVSRWQQNKWCKLLELPPSEINIYSKIPSEISIIFVLYPSENVAMLFVPFQKEVFQYSLWDKSHFVNFTWATFALATHV